MSPGRAARRARGRLFRSALPRTDPSPRPQRGRAGPGPSRECPGRSPPGAAETEVEAEPLRGPALVWRRCHSSSLLPAPPARLGLPPTRCLPALPSRSTDCSSRPGTVPGGTSTVLTVPALFQPCPSLCQHCPRTILSVPRQFQTIPALSQMFQHCLERCQGSSSLAQLCPSTVPGCPSTIATVPIQYPTVLASPQLSRHCPTTVTDRPSAVPDFPSELSRHSASTVPALPQLLRGYPSHLSPGVP